MTAASDGVPRCHASDKTQCYEQLRARVLEARRAPVASAAVLVRQGVSAWTQLDESQGNDLHGGANDITQHGTALPAPKHSELLAVLASLVFNVSDQRESA